MSSNSGTESPPQHLITEPLCSAFLPKTLDNGDIRMAIAKAGQHAYNLWGDEATLTEDFLSTDFKTWEGGEASINHEQNHSWVKATMYDLEYDKESQLVIASFSGIPDWLKSLIYSPDYRGVSQECVPMKYAKNSMNVIRGFGTGATFVTDPYEPAATQADGVGIPPALAAILQSKYPQKVDNMTEKSGGGDSAISIEAYNSAVSKNAKLESQITALESEKKNLETELASTRKEYDEYRKSEDDRTALSYNKGVADGKAELVAETEKLTAINAFKEVHGEDFAKTFLATNPSIEQIKVLTASKKVFLSKEVGSSQSATPQEDGPSYAELDSMWNARLGRS
jgi:hypothetical protein